MRNTLLLILFGLFFPFVVNADEPIANIGELNYDFAEAHRAALGLRGCIVYWLAIVGNWCSRNIIMALIYGGLPI